MTPAHDLPTGSVLQGRYQIVSALGAGGFGAVYKARQLATGQPVAVKVMKPVDHEHDLTRDKRVARFRREMEMCGQLHHPNIVSLIDSGQTDDGRLFAVFEFVPGKTLEQVLAEEGPLHPREARHLMLQVLDALSCAHGKGVVHRDLKPANLMIVSTGTRRNALVLDFGVGAMAEESQTADYSKLTSAHEWLGTPHYTAPEQVRGHPPTTQSDIYAWGLLYLECLTGHAVITGGSVAEILTSQLGPEPVPVPPTLRHHRLGRLIRRATVKEVSERAATASTLLRDLEECDVSDLDRYMALDVNAATMSSDQLHDARDPAAAESARRAAVTAAATRPGSGKRSAERDGGRLVDGERRQVTMLCCSLLPAAERGDDLDAIDDLIHVQQEICGDVADQHRGQLAGGLGHQLLVEFGYPSARDDDARRAARAALAIRAAVAAHNAARPPGDRVVVRIGLHTGLVAYGPDESSRRISGQIAGMTPMVAAQLSARAAPDTIVVSAAAHQLLRDHFELTSGGSQTLDGTSREMGLFQLAGERARTGGVSGIEPITPRLVGRDREMELLLGRWQQVCDGSGHAVLVTGEPGIGKSRLVGELGRRLGRRTLVWLESRCTPETRNRVLHPLIELLDRMLELGEGPPAQRLERLEVRLIGYGFRPAEAVPLFAALLGVPLDNRYPPLDLSPQRQRELTMDAVVSLLIELGERQPVVFLVEDLHWADPTTLEFLGRLVDAAPGGRVLALLTARPEFVPPWPTSGMFQIQLARLARAHVEEIVNLVTAGRALPGEVLDQVVHRTDGVPLFVEELTRMVVESGALTARDGRYQLTGALSEVAIPTTLRDSLTARLDRLGRAKTTAQLASALGREFDLELLTAVSTDDAGAVQEDLDRLTEADLVHHKRRLRNPTWLFRHALIRDTAYESMPRRVQHKVHARIAATLEERFPEVVEARPELLAMHHAAADQKPTAIGYAQQAALGALMGANYPYAVRHAREAIGWLDAIPDPRQRAEMELGFNAIITPSLMSTVGWRDPELEATIDRSAELNDQLGPSAFTGTTLWALMLFRHMGGRDGEQARTLAARLLAHARDTGDTSEEVMAEAAIAHTLWINGRYREAREHFDQVLARYDPAAHGGHAFVYGHDSRIWAAISYAEALWFMGEPDRSLALAEQCIGWGRALNHANTLAVAYIFYILLRHDRGEREAIEPMWQALLELSDRHGLPIHVAYAGVVRSWAVGDVAAAQNHLALLETTGTELGLSFYRSVVAEAEAERGHLHAALTRIRTCRAAAEQVGERYYLAELLRLEGRFLVARDPGAAGDAEALLARAIEVAREQGVAMSGLRAGLDLARLLDRRGRREAARELLAPMVAGFREGLDSAPLVEAHELLAALER